MNFKKLHLFAGFLLIFCLLSCKKTAGDGGNSSISGSVLTENWNSSFTLKTAEYPSTDLDVYIIYGTDVSYSDKTKTNYNGEFEFKYLRKGNYKIYVFSKDKSLTSPSGEVSIVKEVTITDKKQKVTLDRIIIYD